MGSAKYVLSYYARKHHNPIFGPKVRRMRSFRFLFTLLVILSYSCQNDAPPADQEQLYVDASIRYLSDKNSYRIQAVFARGDSINNAKNVTLPTAPAFMGQLLRERRINDGLTRYTLDLQQPYRSDMSFSFVTLAGEQQQLDIALSPIDSFTLPSTWPAGIELPVQVYPSTLQEEETLIVLFTDSQRQTATFRLVGPRNGNPITMPANLLNRLTAGESSVYLVKTQLNAQSQGNSNINLSAEYYTDAKSLLTKPKKVIGTE